MCVCVCDSPEEGAKGFSLPSWGRLRREQGEGLPLPLQSSKSGPASRSMTELSINYLLNFMPNKTTCVFQLWFGNISTLDIICENWIGLHHLAAGLCVFRFRVSREEKALLCASPGGSHGEAADGLRQGGLRPPSWEPGEDSAGTRDPWHVYHRTLDREGMRDLR